MKVSRTFLVTGCLSAMLTACGGSREESSTPAYTETVLHSFGVGTDGANPSARLVRAADGSFYGTTVNGGAAAFGTLFKVTPSGEVRTFYSLTGGSREGANPEEALIQSADGDFYGTTRNGGFYNKGTIFKITAAGLKTILHSFGKEGEDGANPIAALIQASDGSFYGTTFYGGAYGEGTVFRISAAGGNTTLHSFAAGADGAHPAAGLIQGADGDIYGTTYDGGGSDHGTVFRITPAGDETVLHAFGGGAEGAYADVGLVQGSDGNFYGVTAGGGAGDVGTVFKITPAGVASVLYSFAGGEQGSNPTDGASPSSRLIQARDGNFYGTTFIGGANGVGSIYRISPAGEAKVIYSFGATPTGASYPDSALIEGPEGDFYGTTEYGGDHGLGTVYRISSGHPSSGSTPGGG